MCIRDRFVSNLAFARVVNKVALSPAAVVSSFVIVGGVAIAVGSGNHVNKSLGPDDILAYWRDGRWIGYLVGLCQSPSPRPWHPSLCRRSSAVRAARPTKVASAFR